MFWGVFDYSSDSEIKINIINGGTNLFTIVPKQQTEDFYSVINSLF